MADVYKTALAKARLDLDALTKRRDALDRQIVRLNQTVAGLAAIVEPEKKPGQAGDADGLTKTVLAALSLSDEPMTPAEIRDRVTELGYVWKNKQNALNAIHVTLKRLLHKRRVRVVSITTEGTLYKLAEAEEEPF